MTSPLHSDIPGGRLPFLPLVALKNRLKLDFRPKSGHHCV